MLLRFPVEGLCMDSPSPAPNFRSGRVKSSYVLWLSGHVTVGRDPAVGGDDGNPAKVRLPRYSLSVTFGPEQAAIQEA